MLVAALSMRGPIVAPTPVLRDIEQDFGIGSATAGLLTTAPVLMFALLTPLAALVIRRAGAELALMLSLSGVLLGTVIRAIPGFGWMLAGMLVIGAAVTIGNVVIPVIIRRDVPPARVGVVTAAYVATLNAGSLVTSLATAPARGGDRLARSAARVVAADRRRDRAVGRAPAPRADRRARSGAIATRGTSGSPRAARRAGRDMRPDDPDRSDAGRRPRSCRAAMTAPARRVAAARRFRRAGSIYYALSTWLPTLAADELGLDAAAAGALSSMFQGTGIVGAFLVPLLARFTPAIVPTLTICVSWLVLTVGMLVAPAACVALARDSARSAHAGGFVVIFTTLVMVARSDSEAAGMSALVQGGGYGIGALGAPRHGCAARGDRRVDGRARADGRPRGAVLRRAARGGRGGAVAARA